MLMGIFGLRTGAVLLLTLFAAASRSWETSRSSSAALLSAAMTTPPRPLPESFAPAAPFSRATLTMRSSSPQETPMA